jgi:YVTN family beta-propeller protein
LRQAHRLEEFMHTQSIIVALLASLFLGTAAPAKEAPAYRITKTIPLGAPDRWDYVVFDQDSGRVFVAHGDRVSVVDGKTGAIIGAVEGMAGGTHGTGIATALGRGYTDDGRNGVAVAFDLKTLKPLATIKAQPDADGIVFDAASGHIFVIDGDSAKVTVIDPKTNTVVATIDGGAGLEAAIADDKGKLYVDGAQNSEIVRIDTAANTADAHWPIANCKSPHGIAMDRAGRRLFVSCENQVMDVINADTGAIIATPPIGAFTDGAAFDSMRKRAFSSNGDGTLSIIDEKSPDSYVAETPVPTMRGARTMAVDPASGRVYLMAGDYTVNEKADPTDLRHRYVVTPGSAKLLFLDPR